MSKVLIFMIILLGFGVSLSADDIYEPNNTFDSAKTLIKGVYTLDAQDDDWFKIYLTTGKLSLSMYPSGSADLNMILYNSNQDIIASNFDSGSESISYDILSSGYYYIKIYPTSSETSAYTLDIDYTSSVTEDRYEPNNTFQTAKELTKGIYNLSAQNDDWFKIELNSGEVNLKMIPKDSSVDLNMVLYNSNGTVVASNWSSGEEDINYQIIQSGIYYIKVFPTVDGIYSDYTLDINSSSKVVWQKKLNFGPIRDVSVALYDIDNDGKDEIFVATSKALDANLNEIRPAGLICLEDNGDIKWAKTFPAMDTPDLQTGISYTTTSVSTTPFFSDIDGDGKIDILIGVGADTYGEAGPDVVGQPGDKGGVYALNADGSIKWFHQSLDTIGGDSNTGDGRPDGVYGTPIVFDVDGDGVKEVIYGGWDQYLWILDAKDGIEKLKVDLLDTIWSSPKVTDIDKDGKFEILVSADITQNSDAGTTTGGLFHIISSDGKQDTAGFDEFVGNHSYATLKGKVEEQALWSSPLSADIDDDGYQEIIYGTGNFFHDNRGEYIRVWNHDGTPKFKLTTIGRTFSKPIVADINNDGYLEILTTTLDGYLYCWDHNGDLLFNSSFSSDPIFSSPIAIDINNDGYLEIIYTQGAQVIIADHNGDRVGEDLAYVVNQFKGSPAIKDIDDDGVLDLISGGTTESKDQAVVYRWNLNQVSPDYKIGAYQLIGSNSNIENFVKRFYNEVLERDAEPQGLNYWIDELSTGVRAGSDVARGFIFSQEFANKNANDEEYLTILYRAFFGRDPDIQGYNSWLDELQKGKSRADILDGFLYSLEFGNLCRRYNILPVKEELR